MTRDINVKGIFIWILMIPVLILIISCTEERLIRKKSTHESKKTVKEKTSSSKAKKEDLPVSRTDIGKIPQKPYIAEHPKAFDYLPQTMKGDVDWSKAIIDDIIKPRDYIYKKDNKSVPPLDFDIIFEGQNVLPDVLFSHYLHTIWLDCVNCHPSPFLMKNDSNPVSMTKIIRGEFCGKCHGVVAFKIHECERCHSIER
ncbi:MAG: c(7)-type cytochrome triheme domain-containing protein [Nitrospirota bacterium]